MLKKQSFWIILFASAALFSAVGFILLRNARPAAVAYIYSGGELVETIELDALATARDITVEYPGGGYNTVRIEHGRVSVIDADCPDKLCVHQGAIDSGGVPIVCLPHRLVIEIGGGE